MRVQNCLVAALAATLTTAQETVLGVYIFSRHGDRTAKSTPPANLTDLGYEEVFTSGTYYRNRYVASDSSRRIYGLNSDLVKQSQIIASAPVDTVLQVSAQAFLQGIYPPVGSQVGSTTLRNGTVVQTPLNGYQLIPLQTVETGANSENSAWLQGSTNCANAQLSSNAYYTSAQYLETLSRTQDLYNSIYPMINKTFSQSQSSFRNGYTIWDLLNVASIHNATAEIPDDTTMTELKYLADQHEFGLAYNSSEPIRAITGSIIAAEVVEALNATITSKGKSKLNIQFGAYAGMLSFFGLANLTEVNPGFFGVPDYASSLVWELVTNTSVTSTSFPSADQISVRFLFHNGTTSDISEPVEYPLFNSGRSPLPWNDFVTATGVCSPSYLNNEDGSSSSSSSSGNNNSSGNSSSGGLSKVVCGVIGALVTLAVILLVQGAIVLLGGFRLVSKKRLGSHAGSVGSGEETFAAKA
ncbi:hypothetical protein LTR64_004675 [Lithohypha guttulata]|uniref:uncharacterized protein n=1 Tax=Lithohypha guttulata TaxID=1690604 RepID=UPI00315D8169